MARRRLNTKVFATVMGVIVVGGATMFALAKFRGARTDPKVLEERGDAAAKNGQYKEAFEDYAAAVGGNPKSPALRVKLGDACIKRSREDPLFVIQAHNQWGEAVAIDPNYKPALEKLVTSWWERVEFGAEGSSSMGEVYAEIRKHADKLAAIDPSDTRAKVWRHTATVRQWLAAKSVPQAEVEAAVEGLRELAKADPANADASFWLARAKVQVGVDRVAEKRDADAKAAFADAAAVMDQAVAATGSKSAMVLYRAHQVRLILWKVDPRQAELKHKEKAAELIAAAAAAAKAAGPATAKNYEDIQIQWAEQLAVDGKVDEARKVRQELFAQFGKSPKVRLVWARALAADKETRPEAIKIMSEEVPLPPDVVGAGVWIYREHQAQTYNELALLRLADAEAETDPEKKKALLALADEPLDKLKRLANPKAPKVLGLEGQILLAKGRSVEAVQVMNEAVRQFRQGAKDYGLMFVLARTYAYQTNQPGSARQLCEEIVRDNPTFLPARAVLADLLIREGKLTAAIPQIEAIRKQNENYPDLPRLREMATISRGVDAKAADELLKKLPETNNEERRKKLTVARVADRPEDQIRLLNAIVDADPKDIPSVVALYQLYKTRDLTDRAKAVIAKARAASPDDPSLQMVEQELNGVASAELRNQLRERLKKAFGGDPFQLHLKLYELERLPGGDPQAGMAELDEARKLKPDDRVVVELMFKELTARRKFDEAKPWLDKLVALNPDGVGGRLYQHRYAVAKGDYVAAERVGLELVEQYGEFAQSWLALGQAQRKLGKWPEAIRSYTEVMARQPTNYQGMRELVDVYYYAGQTDEAEVVLKEMLNKFPGDTVVRELYLNHLATFGKPEVAIPNREELLRRNPKDPSAYLTLAGTYFKNAQRLASLNKSDESKLEIDKAYQILSQGRAQFPDDARFYAQVAEIRQYAGQTEQAEQMLKAYADREAAKKQPAQITPDPWLALSDFYVRTAQMDKAVAALNEALVRSGNDLGVRLRLVQALVQAGRYAEAVRTLDAVRDNPDPRIAGQRLEILIAQGAQQPGVLPEAEKQIRAELAKRDGPDLRTLLASVLIDTGRADDALAELGRSLQMDPTNEAAKYLRALAYTRKAPPDLNAAITELVELKKSSQRNAAETRLLLSDLYEKTGRRRQAIQELVDALQKTPGSRQARLALVRLYRAERPPQFGAAHDLLTAAENDPVLRTDPSWPREAALMYADQRKYEQAVIKMNQAVQLAPGNNEYRKELIELQLRFNGFAGALVQSDQLLRNGVDGWWLRAQRGVAYGRQVTRDMLAQAAGDPAVKARVAELQRQATAEFDQAVTLAAASTANEAEKIDRISAVLRRMGETVGYDEPLARLTPRLANDPTNDWHLLAVTFKRAKGDFAGAAADAEQMLRDPANGPAQPARRVVILRALADIYQTQSPPDFPKARDRYVELLKLADTDIVSLNNLAYILGEGLTPPDPEAAKEYSRMAFELTRKTNDPNPSILDTHGWTLVLCGKGDLRQGIQILQGVVTQAPYLIEARYHLGEAYLRQTPPAPAEAEKELTEALRLLTEEEKLGGAIDRKLRDRVQTALGRAREVAKSN